MNDQDQGADARLSDGGKPAVDNAARHRRFTEMRRTRKDPCAESHAYQLQDRWFEGASDVSGEPVVSTTATRTYVLVCTACADVQEVRKEGTPKT